MVRVNPNLIGIYLKQHKEVYPIMAIVGGALSWMTYISVYSLRYGSEALNLDREQRGKMLKDREANAVAVRANNAHLVAADPGKISIFGFQRKNAETVGKPVQLH